MTPTQRLTAWITGVTVAGMLIVAVFALVHDPADDEAPVILRAPTTTRPEAHETEVRHLCIALDVAGADSTDQVVLDACRRVTP